MRKWYPIVLIALMLVISIVVYPRLPEIIPTSWTMKGEPDGTGPKWQGLFIMPFVMLFILALLRFLPSIDPRRDNYAKMQGAYDLIVNAVLTLMAAVHLTGIAALLGAPVLLPKLIPAMIGVMLVVVGNVLPQARPNWFVGIRTPWTLSNDRVWERTHRLAGYLMVSLGILTIASSALPITVTSPVLGVVSVGVAVICVVYSYVAWKQERQRV